MVAGPCCFFRTDPNTSRNGILLTHGKMSLGKISFWRLSGTYLDPWSTVGLSVALVVAIPIVSVLTLALFPEENIWPHLASTVLPKYIRNTLALLLGVGLGTVLIGVATAWLVTMTRFPGRRIFEWALLLPFAVPAYVIAYVYTDLLEYAGPVQGFLRGLFGWQRGADYWFPDIRSLGGAICMMTLVLYPYVYLLSRAAFLEQSVDVLETSRVLGCGSLSTFFRVSLPIARPAIAVGLALALIETLNDFGTVDYFGVSTLTAGIYDVWLGMGNLGGAAQIATVMLVFVVALITLERLGRRRRRYFQAIRRTETLPEYPLQGSRAVLATLACLTPIVAGFVVPVFVLLIYAITYFEISWTPEFHVYARNSLLLSGSAAALAVVIGVILAYSQRLKPSGKLSVCIRFASLGYAVPGAVLAIGVIIPFAGIDNTIDSFMREQFDFSTGLILSGTVFAVIFAYVVRFLAIAVGAIEVSLGKVTPTMDMSARTLGHTPASTLARVHVPLIRGGLMTAVLLVFVDCLKELPATLILRPFNFETLATNVYQFASDELIEQAALGALMIVVTGLLPVILLNRTISTSRTRRSHT